MRHSSRSLESGFAHRNVGNPFAVFEIIAEARKIRKEAVNPGVLDRAIRIEQHADGMVKTVLDTADLSTLGIPDNVIEEIIQLLRMHLPDTEGLPKSQRR